MHVISKAPLKAFWKIHPRAEESLLAWWRIARREEWDNFAELRKSFSSADWYEPYVIFDIGGNKYRLIASVHFNRKKVFIRNVLTHTEYKRGKWKEE